MSVARGHLLQLRGPGWLTVPAGMAAGGASASGVLGSLVLYLGHVPPANALVGAAVFVAVVLGLALAVVPRADTAMSSLFAMLYSVGHSVILLTFASMLWWPAAESVALSFAGMLPWSALTADLPSSVMRLAPLYVFVLIVYSAFAPVSLIIFRYIALTRRSSSQ
ncbi:hypothetical protein [Parvularcula sp. LCG005]|uniref:hypothetical protein n=1 Tax=Parvularcula sp. LCG005 TaxID=3078805 RepID=UPI002941F1FF|nr:hypothetical protein [Parvularcula sp. LCG005]WOI52806.1 hypothetical protein RUI03_11675 [Parvularcula sp. LCG005]